MKIILTYDEMYAIPGKWSEFVFRMESIVESNELETLKILIEE
jgi:hypothetical protein